MNVKYAIRNVCMKCEATYVNDVFVEVVQKVSVEQLPPVPKRSAKPWLTVEAFALIDQRVHARQNKDYDEEKVLNGLLKRQIKKDKTVWLESLAAASSWEDLKKLRHPRRPQQGRLQNSEGVLFSRF